MTVLTEEGMTLCTVWEERDNVKKRKGQGLKREISDVETPGNYHMESQKKGRRKKGKTGTMNNARGP